MSEQEILKFWEENKIFEKSLEKPAPKGDFTFYDGPPFATGAPHYGHILASIIKDAIPRYQTMKGKKVPRKWGWDCHGLPVENLIETELNLKSKKDIEKFGIEKFNKKAEESVLRYAGEWKKIIPRIGRWVDMERDYRTMDWKYTESVWWVFESLYNKGLVYEGHKPMHICPRCETTLSNFEVTQGYKEIKDIAVTVKFELEGEPNTFVLAWTTTPWTLPGNVALAINSDIEYTKILKDGESLILAKDRLEIIKDDYEIKEEFKGKDLIGKKYKPLFDYYAKDEKLENRENSWKIYAADFVSTNEGTGVVHIAPAFGEDDMELGKKENLPFVQHVGMDGKFKQEVKDFAGLSVKPKENPQATDIEILKWLDKNNKLFSKESVVHSYPFCWRCDTPLLNYAASSWFVKVEDIKRKMIENNKKINWVPQHLRDGRFGKWLEGARDWAISRSRFWGAPLPVWRCEECEKIKVAGSVKELGENSAKSKNRYLFLRHGQSEKNLTKINSSWPEKEPSPLTEKGRKDTEKLAKKLKKIDIIFSSDLGRTKETAEIISKELKIPIKFDERLREYNTGVYNGGPEDDFSEFIGDEINKFSKTPEGGENLSDIRKRMMDFILEFEKNNSNKKVLIISHGDPLWVLEGAMHGLSNETIIKSEENYIKTVELREVKLFNLPYSKDGTIDLHRPYIDEIEFDCDCGGKMKRIPEVFDCWFESGSMPYGQAHYPFENKEEFEKDFPAEFIAEGVDQTRGWFYTLLVLSTALFGETAYKNVIANGIILAEDGKKMSKRLKNYPDPMAVVEKYGADALRYYLLSSPAARAESLNFSEKGVDEVNKKVVSKIRNVLLFYKMYTNATLGNPVSKPNLETGFPSGGNVLDRWIIARLNELARGITEAMDNYELDKAVRPIGEFVDDLSNWYIRRSRDRFKNEDEDKQNAIAATRYVLLELSKLIAPFVPFVAEEVYQEVAGSQPSVARQESVHLDDWPLVGRATSDKEDLLGLMDEVRRVVALGLEGRAKAGIKVKQPLSNLKVKGEKLKDKEELLKLIKDEINVKNIIFDESIKSEVEIDTKITEELKQEGMARELMRGIQDLRKKAGLAPLQKIKLIIETDSEGEKLFNNFMEEIKKATNAADIKFARLPANQASKAEGEQIKIDNLVFGVKII